MATYTEINIVEPDRLMLSLGDDETGHERQKQYHHGRGLQYGNILQDVKDGISS